MILSGKASMDMPLIRNRVILCLVAIYLTSAVCNVSATVYLHRHSTLEQLEVDEREYYDAAGNLLEGKGEFNPRRPLTHVGILAALRWLTHDNLLGIRIGLALCFSFLAPVTFVLVLRRIGSTKAGMLSAMAVILWPLFIRFSGTLFSETTATPLFILFLLLLPSAKNTNPSWYLWFFAGLLLGITTLSRAMYMLFVPFAAMVILIESGINRRSLSGLVLMGLGWFLAVLPWSLLLTQQYGRFVFVSSGGGETFAGTYTPVLIEKGVQEQVVASGRTIWVGPGKWVPDFQTGYLSEEELKLSLVEKDALLRKRSIEWIKTNPVDAAYLTFMKLALMWGFLPQYESKETVLLGNIPIMMVFLLGIISFIRFWHFKRELVRFWIIPLFVSAIAILTWGSWRFRQPADVGLIVLGSLLVFRTDSTKGLEKQKDFR